MKRPKNSALIILLAILTLAGFSLDGQKTLAVYAEPSLYVLIPGNKFSALGYKLKPNQRSIAASKTQTHVPAAPPVVSEPASRPVQARVAPKATMTPEVRTAAVAPKKKEAPLIVPVAADPQRVPTYYPVVDPSSYSLWPGEEVDFQARGFAPQEGVSLENRGEIIGAFKADMTGSFNTGYFVVPDGEEIQIYTFTGSVSGASAMVQIATEK